jgi:hypothetical protein
VANGLKRRGDHTTTTASATSNGDNAVSEGRRSVTAAAVVNGDGGWLHDDFDR